MMAKKPNARSFGQDLMRGEGGYMKGWGGGKMSKKKQTEDLRGGLTHRTTTDPYRSKKRAANAQPSGGGGGAWKDLNEKMAASRTRLQNKTSLNGLTHGLHAHAYDGGTEDGPAASGTSIFDPVLCELIYRWFCPPNGAILDPFAGGSVRGIVASHLGRSYTGIDLRAEQVEANKAQLDIAKKPYPTWLCGDSRSMAKLLPPKSTFDLVFSCPPYWNLEVYSEDERDLSTLGREGFFEAQADIIRLACSRLSQDRFAAWVVGDVRDAKGFYVNIPGRTVQSFEAAGLRLYNEAILITAAGSLAMRAGKQFETSRKLGKSHQNVLVFCKGDPVKATKAIGPVEFGELPDVAGETALEAYGSVL